MRFIYKLLFISFFILSSVLSFIYLPLIRLESIEIKHNHFIPLTEFDDLVEQYESRYSSIFTWIILQYKLRSFSTKIDSYNVIFKDYKSLVVEIFEKKPWLSFLSEGRSIIVAIDGTILTHGLVDIDLYGFDDLLIIWIFKREEILIFGRFVLRRSWGQ